MRVIDFVLACGLLLICMRIQPKYVSVTNTLPHASTRDFGSRRIYTLATDEDIDVSWDGDKWYHLIGDRCLKGDGYSPFK